MLAWQFSRAGCCLSSLAPIVAEQAAVSAFGFPELLCSKDPTMADRHATVQ